MRNLSYTFYVILMFLTASFSQSFAQSESMVLIPAGEFQMGSKEAEDETPHAEITISSPGASITSAFGVLNQKIKILGIEVGDEVAVAVVVLGEANFAGTDHFLFGLRPARMRDARVNVGGESIFMRQ
jgi:hypothetical protein